MNIQECVGYEQLTIILVTINVTAVLTNYPLSTAKAYIPVSESFLHFCSASFTDMIAISRLKYSST